MLLDRKKIAIVMAEFLGTAVLTAVILAVSKSNVGIPYFISLAAGLTLATGVLVYGSISGAHFNPMVTIGLWSAKRFKTLTAIVYVAAQLMGGAVAYLLYTYFTNTHWGNTGEYNAHILVAETVGAFVFSLGIATAVFQRFEGGKAAFAVGASLIIGVMVASAGGGGILNPAVALGLRSWEWGTFVLGPVIGGIIGFNLYALLFAPANTLVESTAKKSKSK